MKILLIGSGGREHALAWKLAQSNQIEKIFVAPGNAGTAKEQKCENTDQTTIPDLITFAKNQQINLTIVGPEALLVEGIADEFIKEGLRIFAPNKQAAKLEGSKSYAKEFMRRHGVKTARHESFTDFESAKKYIEKTGTPVVVKASGLAAGKGVIICNTPQEAETALKNILLDDQFGEAGSEVVIEEFLEGFEASVLSVCDGETILPFISAKDHKKIGEGETGLNTGGMGVVAPNPQFSKKHYRNFVNDILQPTLRGIQEENINFKGVIFFGLMVTDNDVFLLEYNVRFGDPETQAVLPLLKTDLADICNATIDQQLSGIELGWKNEHSCCIVAASEGYPQTYEKGKVIAVKEPEEAELFFAGVKKENGKLKTNGGRVLNVVATGTDLASAQQKAYKAIEMVSFEGMVFRNDIGN